MSKSQKDSAGLNVSNAGVENLKNKLGFDKVYRDISPSIMDRSFLNGEDIFDRLIEAVRPLLIVEVGTWMGHSAIHMSRSSARFSSHPLIICVDTWLGSYEHYFKDEYLADLALQHGRPTFYAKFLANVVFHGLTKQILPLSVSSNSGYEILQRLGIVADLIYIDAGHGYDDVSNDIRNYRKLLSPTGVIFGDDYFFKPLKRAVDDYAEANGMHVASYGDRGHKWILVESKQQAEELMGDLQLYDFV